jgi:hypothetical protein
VLNGRSEQIAGFLGLSGLSTPAAVGLAAALAAVMIAFARTRLSASAHTTLVSGLLLLYGAVETGYTLDSIRATQAGAGADFVAARNWIDQRVGRDETVTALLGPSGDARASTVQWWDASFFNTSIQLVYAQDGEIYDQGYARGFAVDPATGAAPGLTTSGVAVTAVGDRRVRWRDERELAVNGGLRLVRLPTQPRAAWTSEAEDASGLTPPGRATTLRVYGDGSSSVRRIEVAATVASRATAPARFSVTSGRRTGRAIAPSDGRPRAVVLRMRMPARGFVSLQLRADGSAPVALHDVRTSR